MPKDCDRPRQPEVATPLIPQLASNETVPVIGCFKADLKSQLTPSVNVSPDNPHSAISPPLFTNARCRPGKPCMFIRISSATAPATAAIGVMNSEPNFDVARHIRDAVTPLKLFCALVVWRNAGSSFTNSCKIVENRNRAFDSAQMIAFSVPNKSIMRSMGPFCR